MITEKDLQEAIAECEGQRNPNSSTCVKLAAFYTIRRELYGEGSAETAIRRGFSGAKAPEPVTMSFPTGIVSNISDYDSGSEFSDAIKGKPIAKCLAVIDEMMDVVQTLVPRLYDGVIRKLNDV